mgnify:CR=1 FL=1
MPKYFDFKICGYYLYFTSHCIVEAMHVHASDRRLTEQGSAKLFVKGNGDTIVKDKDTYDFIRLYTPIRTFYTYECLFL